MQISVSDAKDRLTELVRRAEAGEEIVLTRHGQAAVRLVAIKPVLDSAGRLTLMQSLRRFAAVKLTPGPSAARSQDVLYGEDGLPE